MTKQFASRVLHGCLPSASSKNEAKPNPVPVPVFLTHPCAYLTVGRGRWMAADAAEIRGAR